MTWAARLRKAVLESCQQLSQMRSMKFRFGILLAAILSWMLMLPVIHGEILGENLRHLLAMITVVFAIAITSRGPGAVCFAIGWVVISIVLNAQTNQRLHEASIALDIVLLVIVCYRILQSVFSAVVVTSETLRAAVCLYLLLGITFATTYFLGSLIIPDSVLHNNAPARQMTDMIYLSFSTLTTLGYGDIRPNVAALRSVAILEGICGQLFLTLLVARLVGLHTTQSSSTASRDLPL